MKRALFIDRDGTIIVEPPEDYQVDSLEKLEFLPETLTYLRQIRKEFDYEFVMVTNQDGLGTESYPEETFWPAHNKMLKTLEGEGVVFDAIHIDKTFEAENASTRKPRTGLLTGYLNELYDLKNDPMEIINLAKDAKFAKVKAGLKRQLDQWMKENNDEFYSYQVTEMQSSGPVMKH